MKPGAVCRGMLIEVQRRTASVADDTGREWRCGYSPEIDMRPFANFAVGDQVEFYPGDVAQEPLITAILTRTTKLSRPGPGERYARELILAANAELLVAVTTPLHPPFNPRLLDRYLVLAEHFGLEAVLCMNKCDLQPTPPPETDYLCGLGYARVMCSALTGAGIEDLRGLLRGRIAVLSGPSGAGKSSLIRALIPEAAARVGMLRSSGKGRHTTTGGRLYVGADGVRVIDTPGLRSLGLWNMRAEEVAPLWRDFAPHLGQCRFKDCRHETEPGCALHAAVASGQIPRFRLESYQRLLATLNRPEAWE